MGIKRLLIPFPLFLGRFAATFFEFFMKNPVLTNDQLNLLKYDNIPSGKHKTNIDLKLNSNLKKFEEEINKYSYMWKDGGEFSKD